MIAVANAVLMDPRLKPGDSHQEDGVADEDTVVSSDRSSYSDSVLLLVRRQLFQILSIYANIFSFSF